MNKRIFLKYGTMCDIKKILYSNEMHYNFPSIIYFNTIYINLHEI